MKTDCPGATVWSLLFMAIMPNFECIDMNLGGRLISVT